MGGYDIGGGFCCFCFLVIECGENSFIFDIVRDIYILFEGMLWCVVILLLTGNEFFL